MVAFLSRETWSLPAYLVPRLAPLQAYHTRKATRCNSGSPERTISSLVCYLYPEYHSWWRFQGGESTGPRISSLISPSVGIEPQFDPIHQVREAQNLHGPPEHLREQPHRHNHLVKRLARLRAIASRCCGRTSLRYVIRPLCMLSSHMSSPILGDFSDLALVLYLVSR